MAIQILVVDDEKDLEALIVRRFKKAIKENKYHFNFALNGLIALKKIEQDQTIDIVLLDINMPEMDGLTLLSKVANINPVLKVVIVSAYGDMQNLRKAMNYGAFDFLVKPVDFADLELTINKTYTYVAQIKKSMGVIKENDILKMYMDDTLINYLTNRSLVHDTSKNELIIGTTLVIHFNNFEEIVKNAASEEIITYFNYFYSNIAAVAKTPYVDKNFIKLYGTSIFFVSYESNHLLDSLDCAILLNERLKSMSANNPSSINIVPSISLGLHTGKIVKGHVGGHLHANKEQVIIGNSIEFAWHLSQHAINGNILISQETKNLLPKIYEVAGEKKIVIDNKSFSVFNVNGKSQSRYLR